MGVAPSTVALAEIRRGVQLLRAVADAVAPHRRRPPHWSEQHDAIVTDRIEGRFRLGIRLSDFTALLIDRDGTLTRCGLDGLPGVAAGQTLLRAIQGHFGLHGHTLVRVPTATFNAHPVREALAEGSPAAALAAAALAEGHLS